MPPKNAEITLFYTRLEGIVLSAFSISLAFPLARNAFPPKKEAFSA
jgi:hypothetical protein